MTVAPLVWINGFPGTGKFTVAEQLSILLGAEKTILIDNHQLIDPVEVEMARIHPEYPNIRSHPDYQVLRREMRSAILKQYVENVTLLSRTIIFTGRAYLYYLNAAVSIYSTMC